MSSSFLLFEVLGHSTVT